MNLAANNGFRHQFRICRGSSAERRGARRAQRAEQRAEWGANRWTEPGTEPRGLGGLLAVPPTTPGKLETDGESQQKKILSQDKKKYSPTNENTHPTETPICLWYCRFLLMRWFYLTCHNFATPMNLSYTINEKNRKSLPTMVILKLNFVTKYSL